ncbi:hypothetical protein DL96DRAFT_1612618 [Flagelloscypha sp. PMI_526]|nr:hypothetical protein DL96DRAFT_1612618 [Flagelloscypha sp. PMI_526]
MATTPSTSLRTATPVHRGERTAFARREASSLPLVIKNVRLAHQNKIYENYICATQSGLVRQVERSQNWVASRTLEINGYNELDAQGALCHAHIHLDKCFLLDQTASDLVSGDFHEAMQVTAESKRKFPENLGDLYRRGKRVISHSIEFGVTSMRAHVEVDSIVRYACLKTAVHLQNDFRDSCAIDIAVFAQEALFTTEDEPTQNQILLKTAAASYGVTAIGSAPYVEASLRRSVMNIEFILDLAFEFGLFIDFHLDYNLDPHTQPLIFEVIRQAKRRIVRLSEASRSLLRPCITIGHATRLQLFSTAEWKHLLAEMKDLQKAGINIFLVSLPQSDMYMQGRGQTQQPLGAPRGTLRVPQLKRRAGLNVAMAVNNVGNLFTPQGSLDPLSLCSFGVSIFQAATPEDVRTLVRSITVVSKHAIGHTEIKGLFPSPNEPADFVLLHSTRNIASACFDPSHDRTTIYQGKVISRRVTQRWPEELNGIGIVRRRRANWFKRIFMEAPSHQQHDAA